MWFFVLCACTFRLKIDTLTFPNMLPDFDIQEMVEKQAGAQRTSIEEFRFLKVTKTFCIIWLTLSWARCQNLRENLMPGPIYPPLVCHLNLF